jgi:hypothetical protein
MLDTILSFNEDPGFFLYRIDQESIKLEAICALGPTAARQWKALIFPPRTLDHLLDLLEQFALWECKYMRRFIDLLSDSLYQPPGRRAIGGDLLKEAYNEVQEKVISLLNEQESLQSLSTQGSVISLKIKPCPTLLKPWTDFPIRQQRLFERVRE